MGLSLSYNLRHIQQRKLTNALTVGGIALVVFVFAATLMLAEGLRHTLAATGSDRNAIVIRQGSENEIQSAITREQANIVISQPELLRTQGNAPVFTSDLVVLINLTKKSTGGPSNVNIRGVSDMAPEVRPEIKITEGRRPAKGSREVMIGVAVQKGFVGAELGKSLRIVGSEWPIVGLFDAGNSAFSSEVWVDVDVLSSAFRRERFSSVTVALADPASLRSLKERLENDNRLNVNVKEERRFYEDQSELLAAFIQFIGVFVTVIFSLAAVIASMITMYSAVAARTREIGILRAVGFSRPAILGAFAKEALILSVLGGAIGVAIAALLTRVTVSTTNFQTFSELTFRFIITPKIGVYGVLFAVVMGFIGAAFPALHAARLKIVTALRSQ